MAAIADEAHLPSIDETITFFQYEDLDTASVRGFIAQDSSGYTVEFFTL